MPIDATQPYDDSNIFARILRGEIPVEEGLRGRARARLPRHQPAGADPHPGDPKGPYVSWDDFSAQASDAEIAGFVRAVGKIAREAGLVADGYRAARQRRARTRARKCRTSTSTSSAAAPLGPMLAR